MMTTTNVNIDEDAVYSDSREAIAIAIVNSLKQPNIREDKEEVSVSESCVAARAGVGSLCPLTPTMGLGVAWRSGIQ